MADVTPINKEHRNPWEWVPTLYLAEGIPYVIVMSVSVIMFKRMGLSNTDIALYTSWLYLPWVIKPIWSPIVDILRTKRFWITTMQLLIGVGFAGIALTIPLPNYLQYTLAFLWLMAFSSATYDIASDGFYMLALSEHQQAWFVGIRCTFYRIAMIIGQGALVILAGYVESSTGLPTVDVNVIATPAVEMTEAIDPNSISSLPLEGEQRIVVSQTELTVGIKPISQTEADSILRYVKSWNTDHGYYGEEVEKSAEVGVPKEKRPSFWNRVVASPLESFLSKHFSPKKARRESLSKMAGNMSALYFRLAQQPPSGKEVVVNFGLESGERSINLIEGGRYIFNNKNWNTVAIALIQLDPNLKVSSTAIFKARAGNVPLSWMITFFVLSGLFILFSLYHKCILPFPKTDVRAVSETSGNFFKEFLFTFVTFFKKKRIGAILAFLLLYRFAEAQLVKLIYPFMLDPHEVGGLALTMGQVGIAYGTVGILALIIGGIFGGFVVAKKGLKSWLWWMLLIINVPDCVYIYLSQVQPDSLLIINFCIAIEQFGYGFGFTAYMMYMIYVSEGEHKTAHYAICTGFMALGMMIPGMLSGWIEDLIGYQNFFIWVIIATIPSFIVALFIPLDASFGRRQSDSDK